MSEFSAGGFRDLELQQLRTRSDSSRSRNGTYISFRTGSRAHWMAQRPAWIEVRDLAAPPELALLGHLGAGEAEAIQLTIELKAGSLIMDERSGREMAAARNIRVIGIPGILSFASCGVIPGHRQ